jgi:hypothetical protein
MRLAFLIERNSMFGVEWFCAGKSRWTRDASLAIQFPDRDSAKEIFSACRGKNLEFPFTEPNATGDWDYSYSIEEHGFIEQRGN